MPFGIEVLYVQVLMNRAEYVYPQPKDHNSTIYSYHIFNVQLYFAEC